MRRDKTAPPHSQDLSRPLTVRMQKFAEAAVIEPTVERAALSAGYAVKSAREQGARMIRNPRIAAEMARIRGEAYKRRGIDREWVLTQLADLATDRTVAGQARVRALELIGKDLGLFVERREQRTHVVIERRTPGLNPAARSPALEARLASALEAIEAESAALP